jgi:hypothetical protein
MYSMVMMWHKDFQGCHLQVVKVEVQTAKPRERLVLYLSKPALIAVKTKTLRFRIFDHQSGVLGAFSIAVLC